MTLYKNWVNNFLFLNVKMYVPPKYYLLLRMKPNGDWYCPKCNNMNYARREKCNRKECDFEKKVIIVIPNLTF